MDVWRLQHPKTQDYTFYSPVHAMYSRIDYILVEHRLLEWVTKTNIEITTWSDHSPVSMEMKIPGAQKQFN